VQAICFDRRFEVVHGRIRRSRIAVLCSEALPFSVAWFLSVDLIVSRRFVLSFVERAKQLDLLVADEAENKREHLHPHWDVGGQRDDHHVVDGHSAVVGLPKRHPRFVVR